MNTRSESVPEAIEGPVPALVVDASVAIDLLEGSLTPMAVFTEVVGRSGQLLVPPHFWAEVANALARRGRTPLENAVDLRSLAEAGLEVADRGLDGLVDAIGLREEHKLTAYDAIYLQLALDVDGALATLDRELAAAARREGIGLAL
jgi:predicted nucleic acid-binding protein